MPAFIAKPNCWPCFFNAVLRSVEIPGAVWPSGHTGNSSSGLRQFDVAYGVARCRLKVSVSHVFRWTGAAAQPMKPALAPVTVFHVSSGPRSGACSVRQRRTTSCASILRVFVHPSNVSSAALEPQSRAANSNASFLDIMRRKFRLCWRANSFSTSLLPRYRPDMSAHRAVAIF